MHGLVSPSRLHVLMIDADTSAAARLRHALLAVEHDALVTAVARLESSLTALRRRDVACVVTELDLPDRRGLDILRMLRTARPELPVVVFTRAGSEDVAVTAMKLGAADYVRKQGTDPASVLAAVRAAVGRAVLSGLDEAPGGGAAAALAAPDPDFVATTTRMRQALLLVERAAPSRVPVLLEGETGTGKELLARAIHAHGPRRHAPFVVQNCGALSESLLESELFGHVRGAFTGAERDRQGLFAEAQDGTVFLDEVGEAPASVQVKLLRVLQHGEVKAVGADRPHGVRARIVAASNRALAVEVEAGRFRRDLYYRLSVFPIRIPPLRQRAADVPLLSARFLARFEREERRQTGGFAPDTLELLARYPWPGNVRELEHEVHRLVLTVANDQRIRPHHLAPGIREAAWGFSQTAPLATLLARIELALIRQRLEALPTAAARSLGITREALYGKLRRLGAPTRGR
jgi:two-component system, NtrC family, response regulator HydG